MDLDDAVEELYGLDPAEFTARRDGLSGEARKANARLTGRAEFRERFSRIATA